MVSISLIERRLDQGDYEGLLRELTDNGLVLPLSLRMRLSENPLAVCGLALRRVVEITYGPTPLSRQLTRRLLPVVMASSETRFDVVTGVAVLASLAAVAEDQPAARDSELHDAIERGFGQLAAQQDGDGLFTGPNDRSLADRALTTAFLVGLLGVFPDFTRRLRLHDLYVWFDEHDGRLDRHTQKLWDLACIGLNVGEHSAECGIDVRTGSSLAA